MPIYEYQCQSCQDVIEVQQSLAEKPLTTCPACAGSLKKIISMSSFSLKGGGWYADGYSSSGKAPSKPCESKGAEAPAACAAGGGCGGCC
jgi:putative FmdB family regulatory protein